MRVTSDADTAWNGMVVTLTNSSLNGKFHDDLLLCIHGVDDMPFEGQSVKMSLEELRSFLKLGLHMLDVMQDVTVEVVE